MTRRGALAIATLVACWAVTGVARAQAPDDEAQAQALFDEGRRAMAAGDLARACKAFAASQAIVADIGTELNLAVCYEKDGRIASAWALFREVAEIAPDKPSIQLAREHAAKLEPRVPHVTVVVTAPADGLEVKRDGKPLADAALGVPLAVDPGEHVFAATAPGRIAWSQTISVAESGAATVEVPALREAPATRPARAAAPFDDGRAARRRRHLLAAAVGGVGVVAVGVGIFYSVDASARWTDAQAACGGDVMTCSTPEAFFSAREHTDAARTSANVATVAIGVGAAALATGVVLWLTAPSERPRESAWRLTPHLGSGGAGVGGGVGVGVGVTLGRRF